MSYTDWDQIDWREYPWKWPQIWTLDGLSDQDIWDAVQAPRSRATRRRLAKTNPKLLRLGPAAMSKARRLVDCGFDRTMAALVWAEETDAG